MHGHDVVMKTVKIAQRESKPSHHLRAVRAGETSTVLDRDTPGALALAARTLGLRVISA
jgi:antitoxin (DNA-binding transcriptional repressor) of toxin-antitoxin stability system